MIRATTTTSLIPAASYIRMSGRQQEASPDQQRAEVVKLAAPHGYRIVRECFDEAISGDCTDRRTAFLEMREAAQRGEFKAVLCWDQDRFGRFDTIDAGYWIEPFRDAGVVLVTVAQGLVSWTDFQGRLVYMVQQEGKHAYLRDLSRNVVRGQLAGAAQGLWQGGPAPYGYKLVEQRLVPDPKTALVVRRIFRELLQGMSTREIADGLNKDGIPSPNGKTWRFSRISKLVKKRVYTGEFRYGDEPEGWYHWASADGVQDGANTHKGRHYRKETNPVVVPNAHKALVNAADFGRVQRILTDRTRIKSPYRPKGNPYLAAGLLKCGHCHSGMVGMKHTHPGHPEWDSRIYICAGYQQGGTSICNRHYVREQPIVDLLVRKLQTGFLDTIKVGQLRQDIRRQLKAERPGRQENAQRLVAEVEAFGAKIDKGAEKLLAAPDHLVPILTEKLDQWRKEREAVQSRLQSLQRPQEAVEGDLEVLIDQAISELQTLRQRLHEADPLIVREVLREMVAKVELWFKWRPERKRERAVLTRGLIHLRPDLQSIKLVSTVSTLGKSNSMENKPRNDSG